MGWPESLRQDLKDAAKFMPIAPCTPAIPAVNSVIAHLLEAWQNNAKLRIQLQQELLAANLPQNLFLQIQENLSKQAKNDAYFLQNFCDGASILDKQNLTFKNSWALLEKRQIEEQKYCRKNNAEEKKNASYKKRMNKLVKLPVYTNENKSAIKTQISQFIFKNTDASGETLTMKKAFFVQKGN